MDNNELKDYTVVSPDGLVVIEGGELFAEGSVISLTDEQAAPFLESGAITTPVIASGEPTKDEEVQGEQEEKTTVTNEEGNAVTTKKYKVLNESGIFSNFDHVEHAQGEVVELDPENEQTQHFVEGGFVEEVTG